MKNIIIVILMWLLIWFVVIDPIENNNTKKEIVEKSEKENKILDEKNILNDNKDNNKIEKKDELSETQEKTTPNYYINNLNDNIYIEINDLTSKIEKSTENIKIIWNVLNQDVDKIVINFKNNNSNFPNDTYILEKFKKWDKTFEYNIIKSSYKNIDYWINKYLVEAYIWTEVSKLEIIIEIPEIEELNKYDSEEISEDISYSQKIMWDTYVNLPKSELFWNPLVNSNWEIEYSNIDWLLITKEDFNSEDLTSDKIWTSNNDWYLNKNIDSYVYWNTHRDIMTDQWVSFFILRKNWDKYIYEKLYFDFKNSFKWTIKIKEINVKSSNISEEMRILNNELKEENESFNIIETTDKLFNEILR